MTQPGRLDTMGAAVDALANSTPSGKVLFGSMNMVRHCHALNTWSHLQHKRKSLLSLLQPACYGLSVPYYTCRLSCDALDVKRSLQHRPKGSSQRRSDTVLQLALPNACCMH